MDMFPSYGHIKKPKTMVTHISLIKQLINTDFLMILDLGMSF